MTVQALTHDQVLTHLAANVAEVEDAAHFLRGQPGVNAGRWAAHLEAVAIDLEAIRQNLQMTRRTDADPG